MMTKDEAALLQPGDLTRFDVALPYYAVTKGDVLPVHHVEHGYQVYHQFSKGQLLWTEPRHLTLVVPALTEQPTPASLLDDILTSL